MRTVRISDDVWEEIAKRGKFGETVDDVLRRVFEIETPSTTSSRRSPRLSQDRMSSRVSSGTLIVSFYSGPNKRWKVPEKGSKADIRRIRDEAVEFAQEHGATLGQMNAVRKALTDAGYYVSR